MHADFVFPNSIRWICFICLFSLMGCTVPRQEPLPGAQERTLYFPAVTYQDLRAELEKRCVSCHGPKRLEGNYNLSTYAGLLGTGTDQTSNARAGDKDSLLLTILRDDAKIPEHRVEQEWKEQLQRWVVEYRLAYMRGSVHTSDIHLPGAPGFHGTLLQAAGWDFSQCTSCHGQDLKGGGSGVSCLTCHNPQTTAGCASCHQVEVSAAQPFRGPRSRQNASQGDVHQAHFRNRWMSAMTCSSCHTVPTDLRSSGHLDGKLQVALGARASQGNQKPQWDASQHTCTNTYCHNSGMVGATQTTPTWKTPAEPLSCQTCHGNPPEKLRNGQPHPNDKRCFQCHPSVDQDGKINKPDLHINGVVEFAYPKQCNTCHGDDKSPAPPRDLNGNTATTERGVGAHRAHLQANGRNAPVACSACHLVPQTTGATGHLDASLPAEVLFNSLASTHGLKSTWDRTTNTCSQVYCHGASLAGGSQTSPVWTKVDGTQNTCGSCHGFPPRKVRSGASHTASQECHLCHSSMGTDGKIKDPSLHINGRVDL